LVFYRSQRKVFGGFFSKTLRRDFSTLSILLGLSSPIPSKFQRIGFSRMIVSILTPYVTDCWAGIVEYAQSSISKELKTHEQWGWSILKAIVEDESMSPIGTLVVTYDPNCDPRQLFAALMSDDDENMEEVAAPKNWFFA
jgi:hypothetical protein